MTAPETKNRRFNCKLYVISLCVLCLLRKGESQMAAYYRYISIPSMEDRAKYSTFLLNVVALLNKLISFIVRSMPNLTEKGGK